jgi:molybdopterin-containing oxidoreductase family iron-sulfur binding subunit
VRPDPKLLFGEYSNNAWMQELPDPITKLVWDNVAVVSPATAEELGVQTRLKEGQHFADLLTLGAADTAVELPVWVQPGHPDGSISVSTGYGRNLKSDRTRRLTNIFNIDADVYSQGPLCNGVGTNVSALRRDAGDGWSTFITRARAAKSGSGYLLASTQDHPTAAGRPIVRQATLEEYRQSPAFAREVVPPLEGQEPWAEYPELWSEQHPNEQPQTTESMYFGHQWGMAIDLNACTGCNACVVACQSENNIPVIGKDEVSRGREMQWLRIDRYYTGDYETAPGMVVQPMMCVHCENAPCESVCPVAATVHSPDGLNVMVYNRCIGTRYCSNNCPYKVRRFNYYNWTKHLPAQVQMGQNPNVTVRFRGVMEKCTYCLQRIRKAGIEARREDRPIADGEVKTACQQSCPAQAITFGNIADSESGVSRLRAHGRAYELLAELAVRPRTSYMARLRNPNPALEEVT